MKPVWSGRYVHLGIKGNQISKSEEKGATVAEWNVLREGHWVGETEREEDERIEL